MALRLGRVDSAVELWEQCLEYRGRRTSPGWATCIARSARGCGTRASARRRSTTTSAGSTCSRTVPHASSSCACTRGGVFVHAHGGQHARDLRVREGAPPRRTPRRGRRREPGSRNLRPRVRPHRGHGEGAREPRAVRRARPRLRPRGGRARPVHARLSPRGIGGGLRGRGVVVHRGLQLAEQVGDLPSQVELHAALAQLAVYRADWPEVERATDASAHSPSARACSASCASRT